MSEETATNLEGPWPEYIGRLATEVEELLRSIRPDLTIELIPSGDMVTMDFREDRVRLFYDDNGLVTRLPKIA